MVFPWIQVIQAAMASSMLGLWINQMDTGACCVVARVAWLVVMD